MKIISIAGVYGDLENLERLVDYSRQRNADAVTISGNLLGNFLDGKEIEQFGNLNQAIGRIGKEIYVQSQGRVNLDSAKAVVELLNTSQKGYDEAKGLLAKAKYLRSPNCLPRQWREIGSAYSDFSEKARTNAAIQYFHMKQLLDKSGAKIFVVPGNSDLTSLEGVFREENLHPKGNVNGQEGESKDVRGLYFTGYGGSPVQQLPPEWGLFSFNEDRAAAHLSSSPVTEIALTYMPPRYINGKGSWGIEDYLFRRAPAMILAGGQIDVPYLHREERFGTSSIIANPGHLGRNGKSDAGQFLEVDIVENNGSFYVDTLTQGKFGENGTVQLNVIPAGALKNN